MSIAKIDRIKIIGFAFVAIATFISTVIVPRLDLSISELSAAMSKLQDKRLLTFELLNVYQNKIVGKQMFLFEGNMFFLLTKDANTRDKIYTSALVLTKSLTRELSTLNLNTKGEAKEAMDKVDEEYQKILDDHSLNVSQKIDETEKLYHAAAQGAFDRFDSLQSEYNAKKTQITEIESDRRCWYSVFAWLQILGLFLFTGAETVEKVIEKAA